MMTATGLAAIVGLSLTQSTPRIEDFLQSNLVDASFRAVVGRSVQSELAKINRDFAQSYRFRTTQVRMMEPFKLRLDSQVDDMDIMFVMNGTRKLIRIPRANVSHREDLSRAPGKRQTAFDFGLLTPSLFRDLYDATFVRMDRRTGQPIFDVTYKPNLRDGTRNRIWVDPERHVIVRREWYSQRGGHLQATFEYSDFRQVSGVWFPGLLTVTNAEGRFAGETRYQDIRVNTGLPASLFEIR